MGSTANWAAMPHMGSRANFEGFVKDKPEML